MKDWTDKQIDELTTDDKVELVIAFIASMGELRGAVKKGEDGHAEEIIGVLSGTFATFVLDGCDVGSIMDAIRKKAENDTDGLVKFVDGFGGSA